MAYDASGNKENSQQIAGSAPLSQGGQAPAAQNPQGDSATPQGPSTPATVQTGASVNQAASQGQSQNKSAPKASSGMFTNIQKYVQKNQPQAQQMSQAVTEDFGKKAAEIRKATQEKQQQQQQAIQGGTQAMQSQMQEAQGLVGNIMNQQAPAVDPKQAGQAPAAAAAPEAAQAPAAPADGQTDADRFQQLMSGPQVGQVADLNLAQQNMRSQALQNLAQGAMGEQGRRNLMKDTFGDRAYTRGQSALDNLILSGDAGARESLISGVGGESQQLQQDMKGISQEQAQALGEYRQSMGDFGGQVEGLATGAQGEIDTALEAQRKALMEQYGFGAEGGELADLQMAASQQFGEGQKFGGVEDFYQALDDMYQGGWKTKGQQRDKLAEYSIAKARGEDVGSFADWSKRAGGVDANRQRRLDKAMQSAAAEALGIQATQQATGFRNGIPTGYKTQYGSTPEEQQKMQEYMEANKDDLMNQAYDTTGLANLDKQMVLGRHGQNQLQTLFGDVISQAGDYGIDTSDYVKQLQDLGQASSMRKDYGWSGTQSGDLGTYRYDTEKFNETLQNIFSDIGSARESALSRMVENKYGDQGISGEDFLSGQFLDKQGLATQDQADKMLALQNLMGRETNVLGLTPEGQIGQDTAFLEQLRQDLAGSQPEVKTGGTGGGRGLK